jgi:hypothetical protein
MFIVDHQSSPLLSFFERHKKKGIAVYDMPKGKERKKGTNGTTGAVCHVRDGRWYVVGRLLSSFLVERNKKSPPHQKLNISC